MAFERQTNAQTTAGRLTDAAWIADLESFTYLEAGAAISSTDFPEGARSGTLVHVVNNEVKPGKGAAGQVTGLTRYDYDPNARGVGSSGTMSIVVGGVIHVDKLPTMPKADDLPATFILQNDSGKAFTV